METNGTGGKPSAELMEITRSLQNDPAGAEAKLRALRAKNPGDTNAAYLHAISLRLQGKLEASLEEFADLVTRIPDYALAHQEQGITFLASGQMVKARDALKLALKLEPQLVLAWQVLADVLGKIGDNSGATEARARHQALMAEMKKAQGGQQDLHRAQDHLSRGETREADTICRNLLRKNPRDADAICILAEVGIQMGAVTDARKILEQCLAIDPDHYMARLNLASVLQLFNEYEAAREQLDLVEAARPDDPNVILQRAKIHFEYAEYDNALKGYEDLNTRFDKIPATMLEYGHTLRAVGKQEDAVAAYRETEDLSPGNGTPWFALANLKTYRMSDEDVSTMKGYLNSPTLNSKDEYLLSFALGATLEDRKDWEGAFAAYDRGNRIQRPTLSYDAAANQQLTQAFKQVFSVDYVAANKDHGCTAQDPIFVVGLPRSGSTLVEQILASHSQVEGTLELPDINIITRRLGGSTGPNVPSKYPGCMLQIQPEELKAMGQDYIDRTQVRRTGNVYFIDKMPANFQHIGFIKLALPNAKIIDTRRSPMANCFSAWKQSFTGGKDFSYSLEEVGAYYCDYISLMDHWHALFPGDVLTVSYEELVKNTGQQVRSILDYCGLDFEEACLTPHKTERAVRTASSEQVRQPVYDSALEQWRNFEPWLDPLKQALAPIGRRFKLD